MEVDAGGRPIAAVHVQGDVYARLVGRRATGREERHNMASAGFSGVDCISSDNLTFCSEWYLCLDVQPCIDLLASKPCTSM
jgi:hypothetical protein